MGQRKDLTEYYAQEIKDEEVGTIEQIYYLKEDVDNILNELECTLNEVEVMISKLTTELY